MHVQWYGQKHGHGNRHKYGHKHGRRHIYGHVHGYGHGYANTNTEADSDTDTDTDIVTAVNLNTETESTVTDTEKYTDTNMETIKDTDTDTDMDTPKTRTRTQTRSRTWPRTLYCFTLLLIVNEISLCVNWRCLGLVGIKIHCMTKNNAFIRKRCLNWTAGSTHFCPQFHKWNIRFQLKLQKNSGKNGLNSWVKLQVVTLLLIWWRIKDLI